MALPLLKALEIVGKTITADALLTQPQRNRSMIASRWRD
jgi:predicted transposase YbfD/YdcC